MLDPTDVPVPVRDLARLLSGPTPMRRGTLAIRYLQCNKPGCACAHRADARRHGPYGSVVRVVGGRTRSRHVPADRVAELRRQVEAGRQFRQHVEAYWQACEQWADAQLDAPAAAAQEAAQKGAAQRPSRATSSPRSTRS